MTSLATLREGVEIHIVLRRGKSGLEFRVQSHVGAQVQVLGKPQRCSDDADAWVKAGRYCDDQLARVGLEKTK